MTDGKRLVIIDGKSVFYRGYYAMPNLATKDGTPTGGVYGFAVMALEVIKRLKPDYVVVAWDKPKTNIRSRLAIYPQYKAGRKPAPPDFYAQVPVLHELLETFHWPLYELDDYEADDIIGTLAVAATKKDINTFIVTSDLDVLQLVSPSVHAYTLKTGLSNIVEFDEAAFKAKYGIDVHQFIDLKSLKGDGSDNVPGVPGVGEKTAIELLMQYKTLDGVYDNLDLMKETLRKKLVAGKDLAYLSKKLVTLMCDAPVKLDLKASDITGLNKEKLAAILDRLEFKSLLRQLPEAMRSVPGAAGQSNSVAETTSRKLDTNSVSTADAPQTILKKLKLGKENLIDNNAKLEKLTLPVTQELALIAVSAEPHGNRPLQLVISPKSDTVITFDLTKLDHQKVVKKLKKYIESAGLIGYDLKNSVQTLKSLGIEARIINQDVQIGAFLLDSLRREKTLNELAHADLGVELPDSPREPAQDAAAIWALNNLQSEMMSELTGLIKLAQNIEWPIIPVLADMEYAGIRLNVKTLQGMSREFDDLISDLQQQIYGHADQEFNISSPAQLAKVMYEDLNLVSAGVKKGKSGALSTAAGELEKLRFAHPITELIMQYREVTKLKSTYVDTLPKLVDANSRVHTSFNLTIAQTGRLSSTDPNLQNIPVRTPAGRKIRTAFIAGPGNVLVGADYAQFELRLAASFSGDETMIAAFNNDEDIHELTAAAVLGIDPNDITKEQRYQAKAVNFGILYGQGPHGLGIQTGMPFDQARSFITKYFQIRPKLKEYLDSIREKAKNKGFVESMFGRRRPTPDVNSPNFAVREAAYRAAVNMPLQGTAADLTKLAMIQVAAKLDSDCVMLLQIHDSILVECPKNKAKKVGELLKTTMENVHDLGVKLTVEIATGQSWADL